MSVIGEPVRSVPVLVEVQEVVSLIGETVRSSPMLVIEGSIDPNMKRITLIGYLKDRTQAPRSILENVEWEVVDQNIGKIEDGYFIPVGNGETEIIARIQTRDGSYVSTTAIVSVGELLLDRIIVSEKTLNIVVGTLIDINTMD
jgi:hypothetical protein